jgi:hypothetical protein
MNVNIGCTGRAPPLDFTCRNKATLITKEIKIEPLPIIPIAVFDNWFLKRPFAKKPSKGNNGTK